MPDDHEEMDRRWDEQLQELRVMQTGAQLTAGFLLTLPFQSSFADLDDLQRTFYLVLVVLAGLTILIVMTPVAVHRRLSGDGEKERTVGAAHVALISAAVTVSSLVGGVVTLIVDVVVGRTAGLVTAACAAALALTLLAVLPFLIGRAARADS